MYILYLVLLTTEEKLSVTRIIFLKKVQKSQIEKKLSQFVNIGSKL